MKLSAVIDQLVEERGLDRDILEAIVIEGMLAAYEKCYPGLEFDISYDKKTGNLVAKVKTEVVASATTAADKISSRKAKSIDSNSKVGDYLWLPFEGGIGRIEILRAKQIIAARIAQIEAKAVCDEFKDREGTIVSGIIHKIERAGAVIKLQDTMAFLPKSLSIPGFKRIVGYPIRALLKEVLPEPRGDNQLILDRASDQFLLRLFELEIPEVFEKLVEVKKIVRSPGYKSKVAVVSNDPNVDPVGTCVGVGGARIKPILKELGGEKIDVVAWNDDPELLVRSALKPAQINRVEVVDGKTAHVWLDEDQRSLAIGRMGQNISLASRLTGLDIILVQPGESGEQEEEGVELRGEFE